MGKHHFSVTAFGFSDIQRQRTEYLKTLGNVIRLMDIVLLEIKVYSSRDSLQKIASKIPFDEIRDSVTDLKIRTDTFADKKDLYNMENCFNIGSNAIKHKDDGTSVDVWVNEIG
ncbi:hypothetical protein TNCV_3156421, partial [Trichonephila clavipes]